MNTTGIWSEKGRYGGHPCIRGHRFSMSQLVAEVNDGRSLKFLSDDFDIEYDEIYKAWIDLVNELCLLKINTKYIMCKPEDTNCLRDHRIPISLMLMDFVLGNEMTPEAVADSRDLKLEDVKGVLNDVACLLDGDWLNGLLKTKRLFWEGQSI